MTKLIIANWKSNPQTLPEALKLARASDFKNVVIAPPYPYLEQARKLLKKASLGAQNVFWKNGGPYTGEVSASQLRHLKITYVIVGHSERRKNLGETDEMINRKIKASLKDGLKVVLCVGEDWNTRRKGLVAAKRFVANQLKKDLAGNSKREAGRRKLLIAYEPVWAIGTGKADSAKTSAEMISFIKKISDTKVLYGGSVNAKNAAAFLQQSGIDGALVGSASLNPKLFRAIIKVRDSI